MTSLAALFDWLAAGTPEGRVASRNGNGTDFRLRTLPKEDIHVFVKSIDNSTVIRLVDNKDWLRSAGMAGGVMLASVMLIALLMPGGFSLLASRQMGQLNAERDQLVNELRQVRSREAELLNPKNLDQWAADKFHNPTAAAIIFAPPAQGTVASIQKR
jgi:hypothetical protein